MKYFIRTIKIINLSFILLSFLLTSIHCARVEEKEEVVEPTKVQDIKIKKIISGTLGFEEDQDMEEKEKSKALPLASVPMPE